MRPLPAWKLRRLLAQNKHHHESFLAGIVMAHHEMGDRTPADLFLFLLRYMMRFPFDR